MVLIGANVCVEDITVVFVKACAVVLRNMKRNTCHDYPPNKLQPLGLIHFDSSVPFCCRLRAT